MEIIGPLQARVMHYIWSTDRSVEVKEVWSALNSEAPKVPRLAYTTILTVMRNLARRGVLLQEKHGGRAHRFTATTTREQYRARLARYLVATYFDDQVETFVTAHG